MCWNDTGSSAKARGSEPDARLLRRKTRDASRGSPGPSLRKNKTEDRLLGMTIGYGGAECYTFPSPILGACRSSFPTCQKASLKRRCPARARAWYAKPNGLFMIARLSTEFLTKG